MTKYELPYLILLRRWIQHERTRRPLFQDFLRELLLRDDTFLYEHVERASVRARLKMSDSSFVTGGLLSMSLIAFTSWLKDILVFSLGA